jgi:hypothetical protein
MRLTEFFLTLRRVSQKQWKNRNGPGPANFQTLTPALSQGERESKPTVRDPTSQFKAPGKEGDHFTSKRRIVSECAGNV